MSTPTIVSDQFYHVYNRGNQKQTLFRNERDYIRFLFLLLHLQAPVVYRNLDRQVNYFQKNGQFKIKEADVKEITTSRQVTLLAFCIMPNHFHLCVKSHSDTGLSEYMHRIGTAYSMYFNKKYNLSGHVFQGTYKAKVIEDDNSLVRVNTYIHQNPWEIQTDNVYLWSSLQDYEHNRWGRLVDSYTVMERFTSYSDYLAEVQSTHQNKLLREDIKKGVLGGV